MKLFRSKYNALRDEILTEIAVLESQRGMTRVDQEKTKITLDPENWIKHQRRIDELTHKIDILKVVLK